MMTTFAALAEPTRFRIVELLRSGPRPVNDIGEELGLIQPQVSKHLRVLREAGLVAVSPHAQQRHYALRPEPLRALDDWLERYRQLWDARFDAMDALVTALTSTEKSHARRVPRQQHRKKHHRKHHKQQR